MTTTTTTGGTPLVVGLGGTLRANSSTERALRYCLASVERQGGRTRFFSGPELDLPMYAPHELERTPKALELVSALRDADAVVVGSPGYHGAISGSGEERPRLHRGSARGPARLPRQHTVGLHQLRLRVAGGGRHARPVAQHRTCVARLAHPARRRHQLGRQDLGRVGRAGRRRLSRASSTCWPPRCSRIARAAWETA